MRHRGRAESGDPRAAASSRPLQDGRCCQCGAEKVFYKDAPAR